MSVSRAVTVKIMGEDGEDIIEHLSGKYGPAAGVSFKDENSPLRTMGRQVGINFLKEGKMVNTRRAHALMEALKAKDNEKANEFMTDLYKAYFEQAKNVNDEKLLMDMAKPYGVEENEARAAMTLEKLGDIDQLDYATKRRYGVSGVPFFMIHPNDGGRPVAFSGAYPVEIIAEQLEEAVSE